MSPPSAFASPCAPGVSRLRPCLHAVTGRHRVHLAAPAGARTRRRSAAVHIACAAPVVERSASFLAEGRFYRAASAVVRDMGVLAAAASEARLGRRLRVLDACSGSGVRSLRYLSEAPTAFVWANDAQTQASSVLAENLADALGDGRARVTVSTMEEVFADVAAAAAAAEGAAAAASPGADSYADDGDRLRYDLVDLDVFGACSRDEMRLALGAVSRAGGLLYLSSTDAATAAGHNAAVARRAWDAELMPHPAVNEQFLRVVVGCCARVAAEAGLAIKPVFSFFHNVSSTARVMVRVKRAKAGGGAADDAANLGYVTHCPACGQNGVLPAGGGGGAAAACGACGATQGGAADAGGGLAVSGPVWTGRLHNVECLREMRALARSRQEDDGVWHDVQRVISKLIEEAEQPPLFYELGELARRCGTSAPPRQRIFDELARRGYSASPAHCRAKALKTDAPYAELLDATRTAAADVAAMHAAAASAQSGDDG